ncbi:MAG: lysophospholipid acyltransferase family protein [Anaerolineae bacterium]
MGAKAFFAKGWPTRLGFYLGKYLPPRGGKFIAALITRVMVAFKSDVYWNVRANLRHVLGPQTSERELHQAAYRLMSNAHRGYYELFHNVGRGKINAEEFFPPVRLTAEAKAYLDQGIASGRGLFILGAHMSNFDLALIGLSQYVPVPMQALSLAEPPPGFEFFNRLREKGNVLITPISPRSLRDAMVRLRQGGVVVTGVDRPLPEGNEPVEFFGATAYLPTGYIRIPLRTDCLVMTIAAYYDSDEEGGAYSVMANPPMEMERTGDAEADVALNLRRVLAQIEVMIRRHPDQWHMFVPVWPESLPLPA